MASSPSPGPANWADHGEVRDTKAKFGYTTGDPDIEMYNGTYYMWTDNHQSNY